MDFLQNKTGSENPKTLLLIGKPKIGKSTVASYLPNSIYLDFENGTNFITHPAVFNVSQAEPKHWKQLQEIGSNFDYCIVDSCTSMENWLSESVVKKYNEENKYDKKIKPIESVIELAYGVGYGRLRTKTLDFLEYLNEIFKRIVFLGHSKDKQINSETIALDLDMTGKNAPIFLSRIDVVGYLSRRDEKLIVNFSASTEVVGGSRADRLEGKEFLLSEKTQNGIQDYWESIFTDLKNKNVEETQNKGE